MNSEVWTRTFIYVSLLLMGYFGKRLGAFHREDTRFISRVVLNLTMPAAVINGFQGVQLQPELLWALGMGLAANALLILAGQLLFRRNTPQDRVAVTFSISAFNIGNFTMPFLLGLISPTGFAALCLFDIAGVITSYGVNVALAEGCMGGAGRLKLGPLARKMATTPVIVTYGVLVVLAALGITLPKPVLELTGVLGGANAFLAMLSIGILFELHLPRENLRTAVKVLVLRYGICAALLAVVLLLVPVTEEMKLALCVVLMAPCASSAPMMTEAYGGSGSLAAGINSANLPVGIALMTLVLSLLSR